MATDNPIRILFVEDLPSDMELAEHELRRESISFTSMRVETREGFLKALEEFRPDLIISDYALPEFDGMQALKLWRQQHPAIPFIILTGSMNEETAVACMKAGATDYVIKERIKRLPFAVQEALEQQSIRSEKERAEQALRESEARYRVLFESINDAVFVHYVEETGVFGSFSQVNDVACQRLGYSKKELLALTTRDITTPEKYEIISAARGRLLSKGEIVIETVHVTKDGRKIPTESSVHLFNYLGKQAVISIARDITERKQAEDALRRSEEEFRSLAEAMPQIVWACRPDGGNFYFNQQWVAYTGMTLEESYGAGWNKPFHPDDQQRAWDAWQNATQNNDNYSLECRLRRADGAYRWWLIRGVPLLDASGTILKWYGTCTDIGDIKEAEAAVRESEERFRRAVVDSPFPILLHAEDGAILQASNAWCEITGYTREELATTADWAERAYGEKKTLMQADIDALYDLDHRKYEGDYTIRTKSGDTRIWEFSSAPLGRLPDGRRLVISMAIDVTERRSAESARERLITAVDQAGEMIVITDSEGAIQYVNPAFERVTGYTRREAIGQTPRLLKSGQQGRAFYEKLWQTISGGGTYQNLMVNKRKDGTFYTEEATITSVRDASGRIVNYVAVKRDITAHLLLTAQFQQSQKMETVGHLAGGIAHDFNNILAAIIGYANLLQTEMNKADPLYSHVEHILSSSERAATLVHSLLAFSRKQTLSVKQVRINDLVQSVSKLLGRLLGEDITFGTVFTGSVPQVMADAGQIDQILFNLATNARDAMPEGGYLTITTEVAAIDDTYIKGHGYGAVGDYALITVSDTGAGMDKALQEKIFEPFFTTKEVGKGTGLGLSTVYGIVKQHNGFINCYSEPGKGTTFKIYLPLLESDEKAEDEKTGKRTELMPAGNETILVAEDDAAVRELIKLILSQYGYTIYEAEDGAQAVQVFTDHAQEINLLLFDIIMPRKNGREAYQEIQNIRPGVPVIFTSGYTADIVHKKGFLEEGFEILLKPVSMTALLQKVREVLDKNRQ